MEYINSRKRLSISRHILGNNWILEYRVKTWLFGYMWVTVASCPVCHYLSINEVIDCLQTIREVDKWNSKGFELSYLEDAK
jgi:hypothetical protein